MTFRTIVYNDLRDLALDIAGGVNYSNKELQIFAERDHKLVKARAQRKLNNQKRKSA